MRFLSVVHVRRLCSVLPWVILLVCALAFFGCSGSVEQKNPNSSYDNPGVNEVSSTSEDSRTDDLTAISLQAAELLSTYREQGFENFAGIRNQSGERLSDAFELGEKIPSYLYENGVFREDENACYPIYNNNMAVGLFFPYEHHEDDEDIDGEIKPTFAYYGNDASFVEFFLNNTSGIYLRVIDSIDGSDERTFWLVGDGTNWLCMSNLMFQQKLSEETQQTIEDYLTSDVSQLSAGNMTNRVPFELSQ